MKIYKFMSLYHYCPAINKKLPNKYTKLCIESQKVYFNNWEDLNDPMEGFYLYIPHEHNTNLEQILRQEKLQYKIFCCSKEYSNILMWSHYADNHKGICLEIEIDENICKEQNIFNRKIVYRAKLVSIVPKNSVKDNAKYILKHKLSKWNYEKEIRFFIKNQTPNSYKIGNITSILLGARCNTNDKKLVEEWIGKNLVALKKVDFNENTNRMEIIENE